MINGIILVDKPKGMSSNGVANYVKKMVKADKAGHLGTLDVAGHGLLPITLGKSTKLFNYFLNKDKVYRASFLFGIETETLDLEGEVTKKEDINITTEQILDIIPQLIGKQNQMPPIYSAKKIHGRTAYDLARHGIDVELKPKLIEIYNLKLIGQIAENEFLFEIHCSSGTYIRSLCRDMAHLLSTCGIMSDIIRTKCGIFDLKNANTLEEIRDGNYTLIQPQDVFNLEQNIFLNADEELKILNGVKINVQNTDGLYKVYGKDFLGLGKVSEGILKLEIRLI